MELFFTCPCQNKQFGTEQYRLEKGYTVTTDSSGTRSIKGRVQLDSPCPFCGEYHFFDMQDVGCPLEMNRTDE